MWIEIKHRHAGEVLFSGAFPNTKAAVEEAVRQKISLKGADLYGADLYGADLYGADLEEADLEGANLAGASFYGANLKGAGLEEADLEEADLEGANLAGASFYGANLKGASFCGANLAGAYFYKANLEGATGLESLDILPERGDVIGWKKCRREVLVKLLIRDGVKRSSATTRKCRAEEALVLEVIGGEVGVSGHDPNFRYIQGEIVRPTEPFNEDRWVECGTGIHFFTSIEEAKQWRCL